MGSAVQVPRTYRTTMVMGIEDAIAHVEECPGRYVAGRCGGLYVCNSCGRNIGRCHSQSDMPAVCLLCRARYLSAWSATPRGSSLG